MKKKEQEQLKKLKSSQLAKETGIDLKKNAQCDASIVHEKRQTWERCKNQSWWNGGGKY